MTETEKKSLEETAENMAKENGWTKEQAYNYVRKMTYTSDDAAGCTLTKHDNNLMTCRDCILKYNISGRCLAYQRVKPNEILDGGECEHKRTE